MAIPVVPYEDPNTLEEINLPRVVNPWWGLWWADQTVSGIPETVMGWLVAQGWRVTDISQDATTTPPTLYYALTKPVMDSASVLLSLCNNWTLAANDARGANQVRYNETLRDWKQLIESQHTHFEAQVEVHNADWGLYITELDAYMDKIEEALYTNRTNPEADYELHKTTTRDLLVDLGTTEVARINEQFAASLSEQLQMLIDHGLYTSAVAVDITARNHRDRDEQLQKHYDALAREKLGNEHQLFAQRLQLADHVQRAIVNEMNTAAARLDGWKTVADMNQKLMAYQLDTRNQLVVGLYGFVERREDIAPERKDMSQMISGLGDSAGGWLTP